MNFSRVVCAIVLAAGVALLGFAFAQAAGIPEAACDDLSDRERSKFVGGNPGFGNAYIQMSANRRLLQNAYLGGFGLLLSTAGCFGLIIADRRNRAVIASSPPSPPSDKTVPLPGLLRAHIAHRDQLDDGNSTAHSIKNLQSGP